MSGNNINIEVNQIGASNYNPIESSLYKLEHTPGMKCITLAHQALARDWYNNSLATITNAEWLVCSMQGSRLSLMHVRRHRRIFPGYLI